MQAHKNNMVELIFQDEYLNEQSIMVCKDKIKSALNHALKGHADYKCTIEMGDEILGDDNRDVFEFALQFKLVEKGLNAGFFIEIGVYQYDNSRWRYFVLFEHNLYIGQVYEIFENGSRNIKDDVKRRVYIDTLNVLGEIYEYQ